MNPYLDYSIATGVSDKKHPDNRFLSVKACEQSVSRLSQAMLHQESPIGHTMY